MLLLLSVRCGVRVGYVQTSLEQVLGKTVNRVTWLTFADVEQTIS